jgi:hypothetical protein
LTSVPDRQAAGRVVRSQRWYRLAHMRPSVAVRVNESPNLPELEYHRIFLFLDSAGNLPFRLSP